MLRPPRLLSIIAASCLTFFAYSASAQQPAWDDEGDGSSDSAASGSSEANTPSEGGSASAPAEDDFADPTAGGGAPSSGDPDADFGEVSEEELDERLATLGGYLKDIQAPTRAHTAGWILLNAGLTGFFSYDATTRQHERAVRASDIMRATLGGVNLVLTAITPMPGRSAWRKFKKMPESTVEEKRAKLDAGRKWLSGQVAADKKANEPAQHIIVGLTALGCGLGLFFGYDDGMRPAVETALGIVLLAELQIATRPKRTRRYNIEFAERQPPPAPVQVSFAPMMTRTSQGIGLVGRF